MSGKVAADHVPMFVSYKPQIALSKLVQYRINSRGQPTRGGPPAWGLGGGLTTPHRKKKKHVMKCYKEPRNWMDALERPKLQKMDMRFGM
jgi:hypothetical protein